MSGPVAAPTSMAKRVAIVQSNYIPWKGYFDLIRSVDEFILYDDVQYTRRDWRNRNRIKTRSGPSWLSIPVQVKGNYFQSIRETRVADPSWAAEHWQTIRHNYAKAPHFAEVASLLEPLYLEFAQDEPSLSAINRQFLTAIRDYLGLSATITSSSDYMMAGDKTERLAGLCRQAGASEYLSGPAARDYLDEDIFRNDGIAVTWADYSGFPEYPQFFPPFEHGVSIIDLLFHTGPDAPRYLERA